MAAEPVRASVFVEAQPSEVYEYFTTAEAMVRWMGQHARLDPRPGGEFAVDIDGYPARGRFVELDPPRRVLFTWGFAGLDDLPPGSSSVEVTLSPTGTGTLVELVHHGLPDARAKTHSARWSEYLDALARTTAAADPGPTG